MVNNCNIQNTSYFLQAAVYYKMATIKTAYIEELARRIIDCLDECRIYFVLVQCNVVEICYGEPDERVFSDKCCHSYCRSCIERCPNK